LSQSVRAAVTYQRHSGLLMSHHSIAWRGNVQATFRVNVGAAGEIRHGKVVEP
jgi:hypothetical protein